MSHPKKITISEDKFLGQLVKKLRMEWVALGEYAATWLFIG